VEVPGDRPPKDRGKGWAMVPSTQEEPCTLCGTCAAVCPTAAIAVEATVVTDVEACILCCACVKNCPAGAHVMDNPRLNKTVAWLSRNCAERKEPEVYIEGA
jgi:ferredoxin